MHQAVHRWLNKNIKPTTCMNLQSIHLISAPLILHKYSGNFYRVYPRDLGYKAGKPSIPREAKYNHTHPVTQRCQSTHNTSLDWGRKPEYPEETPEAQGDHANSTKQGRGRNQTPKPWRQMCEELSHRAPLHALYMTLGIILVEFFLC